MKNLNPRAIIAKNQFKRNDFFASSNEGVDHFYEIDTEGNIAFYLVCDGRGSLDWILEDLTHSVIIEKSHIYFELKVVSKSIIFTFILEDVNSIYSITRIAIQPNIMLYYLMEYKNQYIYLGYNQIDISKDVKENILRNINYKAEVLKAEAKECP